MSSGVDTETEGRAEPSVALVVDACLERIARADGDIRAWQHIADDAARAAARQMDHDGHAGPLKGMPIGVKDLIDTVDAPTTYGSPIYADHRPIRDAACVAALRKAGAVIIGKTVTTEFATFKPPVTVNPHNPAHTPGGSSSGSAAAVAANMVPVALGTQTAGSVIRPAAFCGVVGYKPTVGTVPTEGVKPLSAYLDTVGTLARHVRDAALVAAAMAGPNAKLTLADADALGQPTAEQTPPKLGFCQTPFWDRATPATQQALTELCARLRAAGVKIEAVTLPDRFADLNDAQNVIMWGQSAVSLRNERYSRPELLSDGLRAHLTAGADHGPEQIAERCAFVDQQRDKLDTILGPHDALIVPAAIGEAPTSETTGDPLFNRMWTALGTPCITVPIARGPNGLPLGVQFVGRLGDDGRLLAAAQWVESVLSQSTY